MLTRKFLMMFLCGTLCLGAVSCSKDDDDDSSSGCADIEEAIEAEQERVEEAFEEYEDDDNDDNCEALEDAFDEYIDTIETLLDCPDLHEHDEEYLEELLDEAEEEKQYLCSSGGTVDCDDTNALEDAYDAYYYAMMEYQNDPDEEKCSDMKVTGSDLIIVLNTYRSCADDEGQEYLDEEIDNIEDQIENICD